MRFHDASWLRTSLLAVALTLQGCNIYGCTYESRFIGTAGSVTAAHGRLVVQFVNMREYRSGGPVPNALIWSITAEGLASPPKTLTLRNASGVTVATLTMSSTSSVSMVANGSLDTPAGDPRFALLESGQARVVLELNNGDTITAPLTVSLDEDWHQPNCS